MYFITDKRERLSKATGVQCALLAPDHVTLCRPHELPRLDPETAVLLFPEEGAASVADVVAAAVRSRSAAAANTGCELPSPSPSAVVIIDSKWHGAQLIASTPNLRHLPRVKLATYRTAFWRFHPQPKSQEKRDVRDALLLAGEDDGDDKVCSAEALFFFMRELHHVLGVHREGQEKMAAGMAAAAEATVDVRGTNGGENDGTTTTVEGEINTDGDAQDTCSRGGGGDDSGGGSSDGGRCHCFDDLLWYFAWQHKTVAASAAVREYHPVPSQRKKAPTRSRAFSKVALKC